MTTPALPPETEILLYTAPDGMVKIDVLYQQETLLLSQKKMAALFGVQVPAIAKHLKNIFETGELQEQAVVSILEIPAADGKVYATHFYSLDDLIVFLIYFRTEPRTSLAERCLVNLGERGQAPFAGQYGNKVKIL